MMTTTMPMDRDAMTRVIQREVLCVRRSDSSQSTSVSMARPAISVPPTNVISCFKLPEVKKAAVISMAQIVNNNNGNVMPTGGQQRKTKKGD